MFYEARPKRKPQQQTATWPQWYEHMARTSRNALLKRFYGNGPVAPDTPLQDVPFVAMDFETTGLDPRKDGIISIGLVPFTLQRIRLKEARHWLLNPHKPLTEESVVIHGITHSDIEDEGDVAGILRPLLDELAGRIPVVHHRGIERPFLDAALKARIGEGILFPVIDTMELEARLHRKKSFWRCLLGVQERVSIRLWDSRERYNLPHYSAHHATVDALATAELLQAQIAYHFSPTTTLEEIWS